MKRFSALAGLATTDIAIGFAVQLYVLLGVGIGPQTDAYFAGLAPTLVLLAILQMPIQRAVVSAYTGNDAGPFPALRLYGAIVGGLLVVVAVLALAGEYALHFLYPGLSAESLKTALATMQVHGLAVSLAAGNLVLLALNQIRGRFIQCEVGLVSASLAGAVWVLLTLHWLGVVAAAWGQFIKSLCSGVAYMFLLRGQVTGGKPPWRSIWEVIRPLSTAGLLSKLAPIVDRSIASAASAGSLTVLVFAQTIFSSAVGVADRAIVAPRIPELKRNPDYRKVFTVSSRLALAGIAIVIATSLGALVALQVEWIHAVVPRNVLQLLMELLILLAGLPIGTLAAQWLAAALVFVDKARITARIMTWCFLLGIPVKYLGFELGGIRGLAVAMSCYYLASAAALWLTIRSVGRAAANRPNT